MKNKIAAIALMLALSITFTSGISFAKKVRRIPSSGTQHFMADLNPMLNSILGSQKIGGTQQTQVQQKATQQTQMQQPGTQQPSAQYTMQTQQKAEAPVSCQFDLPKKISYSGQFVSISKKAIMAKKELFKTKVYIQNTGNTPWFAADSGCKVPSTNLGTDKNRDRQSPFFLDQSLLKSNWLGKNRIKMTSKRVDPQGVAEFTYWSQSPDTDGVYREFYTPVTEGVTWIDSATYYTDTTVGSATIDPAKINLISYIRQSTDLSKVDLSGDKSIDVSLSRQRMLLKIGDYTIREFPVSTGGRKHPTPVGTTKILNKAPVRVAGSSPHYIMPQWMMYRKGGFGIHALPSLGNDHGIFWREALSHIGIPVSHGCIRLLPDDAVFAYGFAEVGTTVVVHW
jgi:lipoprotein-anchoring transpeptidase ErfK/SrfK